MPISINSLLSFRGRGRSLDEVKTSRLSQFSATSFAKNNLFVVDSEFTIGNTDKPVYPARGVFPFPEIESEQVPHKNSYKYRPGRSQLQPIEVEFYETEDSRVWDYFERWHSLIHNDDGTYRLPSEYEKSMVAFRLDSRLRKVFGFYYENVWPMSISPYTPSADAMDVLQFTITFRANLVYRLATISLSSLSLEGQVEEYTEPDYTAEWQKAKASAATRTGENATRSAFGAVVSPFMAPLNVDNPLSFLGGTPSTILGFNV